jgi:O-antigen/teichoic acid export membrane protein
MEGGVHVADGGAAGGGRMPGGQGRGRAVSARKTVAVNTCVTYFRSLAGLFLSLFSGRWVLQALGTVDYGLSGVVGAMVVFVTFLSAVMAMSTSRHLSFAMGQRRTGDEGWEHVRAWFNAALFIHVVVPLVLLLIGYPVGHWLVRHWLVIPEDRLEACVWVFKISVFSSFFAMVSVPFRAVYVARQRMAEQACYELMATLLKFFLAWTLVSHCGDKLIYYAGYTAVVSVGFIAVFMVRAWVAFPETRIRFSHWRDREKIGEIIGFASWNLFGALGWLVNGQGIVLVGNKFFGPAVNAAMSVASQVSGQVTALSNAVISALTPEIVTTEGAGDRDRMVRLAFTSCRLAALLNLVFMIPLCFEMNYVLTLWLKHPPEHSVVFCQLALLSWFLNSLSTGHGIAIVAVGKIRGYQLAVGLGMMVSPPLAWLGCRAGFPPWSMFVCSALAIGGCSFARVVWARVLAAMSVRQWFSGVFSPVVLSCLVTVAPLIWIVKFLPESFVRLVLTTAVSGVLVGLSGWMIILSPVERTFLKRKLQQRFAQ